MIINLKNLKVGIQSWKAIGFPDDYLNSFYFETYLSRAEGITKQWWSGTVDRLGQWRAYRGPTPPNTKAEILSRGQRVLHEFAQAFTSLYQIGAEEPAISSLSWNDIEPLYSIARGIKRSHVFASKLCHFLFPNAFIVMDNQATQVFDYEFYWRGMKDEWNRFSDKELASQLLRRAISSKTPLHKHFPIETKLMELSHIGHKHGPH